MDVHGVWEAGKVVIQVVILPAIGFVAYFFKRSDRKMEQLEDRLALVESNAKVLDERVSNMKEDLKEIKEGIKELLKKI